MTPELRCLIDSWDGPIPGYLVTVRGEPTIAAWAPDHRCVSAVCRYAGLSGADRINVTFDGYHLQADTRTLVSLTILSDGLADVWLIDHDEAAFGRPRWDLPNGSWIVEAALAGFAEREDHKLAEMYLAILAQAVRIV